MTWAQLIRRVKSRPGLLVFDGRWFRTGRAVEESELRPSPDYPAVPVLLEYAGSDGSGRGHRRSRDVHILWRYDPGSHEWLELARALSTGAEWVGYLAPIVRDALRRPPAEEAEEARRATERVMAVLDDELDALAGEHRSHALAFLYDHFAARLASAAESAHAGS